MIERCAAAIKLRHIAITHFILTFVALVGCFIWLAVTNAGNSVGRHGTAVTYKIPVYWMLIGFGQMFAAVSVYILVWRHPGYVMGQERSRYLGGSKTADLLLRLIPAVLGLSALTIGLIALAGH